MSKYGVAVLATLVPAPAAPQVLSGGTLMALRDRSVCCLGVLLAIPVLAFCGERRARNRQTRDENRPAKD